MSPLVIQLQDSVEYKHFLEAKGENNLDDGIRLDGATNFIQTKIRMLSPEEREYCLKDKDIAPYLNP